MYCGCLFLCVKHIWKIVLICFILFLFVGCVSATDNTDSLNTVEYNTTCQLNNSLLNSNKLTEDTLDLACVPLSLMSIMASNGIIVSKEEAINKTNVTTNIGNAENLANGVIAYGSHFNVIKIKNITDFNTLKTLYTFPNINIVLVVLMDNRPHFGHVKEMNKEGILFNHGLFMSYSVLKKRLMDTCMIESKYDLDFSCFGEIVNRSEWVNIKGQLSPIELFKFNYVLIDRSLNTNGEYLNLKMNIKDEVNLRSIESMEIILFRDSLKPKMANLAKIKDRLEPVYNNPNVSPTLLVDLNNILTPMQVNLNDTISHLKYLINTIKELNMCGSVVKSFYTINNVPLFVDVSKWLNGGCNLFMDNFKKNINSLYPLNAYPELKQRLDAYKMSLLDYYSFVQNGVS